MITTLPRERCVEAVALWHAAGLTRPWNDPDADLGRALDGPSSTVLAATAGERLVGTVMVGHDGHRGWLYYLAVAEEHRRRGVGRALVAAAERWLGARVPKVQLMVRDDNAAAVAFYERLGYARQDTTVLGRRLDTEGGVERVAPRTPDVSDGPPLTSTGAPRGPRRPRRGGR